MKARDFMNQGFHRFDSPAHQPKDQPKQGRTLALRGARIDVSDDRGTVKGAWVNLDGQDIGTAIPPEGDSVDCWLSCWAVLTPEEIRAVGLEVAGLERGEEREIPVE